MNDLARSRDAPTDSPHFGSGRQGVPGLNSASLGVAFWLLVTYFVIDYVRPQDHFHFLTYLRPGAAMSLVMILFWLAKGDKSILREPIIILYILFIVVTALGVPFAVNNRYAFNAFTALSLYLLVVVLPSTTILRSSRAMSTFMKIWTGMHILIVLMTLKTGRGSGNFLDDENDLALVFDMMIPYAFFLSRSPQVNRITRMLLVGAVGMLAFGVIVTNSRGGFLGLVAVIGGLIFFSRNRIRNFMLLAVLASAMFVFIPRSYFGEVESITNPEDSTRVARLYLWGRAWDMFLDNWAVGVGAQNFPWRINQYERTYEQDEGSLLNDRLHGGKAVHSLFFSLLPEYGVLGSGLYIAMIVLLVRKLTTMIKTPVPEPPVESPETELLAKAMLVSLMAFFICGTFLSVLYYPHFWYLIGFTLALERLNNSRTAQTTT